MTDRQIFGLYFRKRYEPEEEIREPETEEEVAEIIRAICALRMSPEETEKVVAQQVAKWKAEKSGESGSGSC